MTHAIRIVISRIVVAYAHAMIQLGWAIIRGEARRFGLKPPASTEPSGPWLEVQWW